MLGGVGNNKSHFWQIEFFAVAPQNQKCLTLPYRQSQKNPKIAKIPKSAKMVKKSRNNDFNPPNQNLTMKTFG